MTIETENEAFDNPYELPAALERVIQKLEAGADSGRVIDSNGNSVGAWQVQS